jgi:hypothetical protein
MRSFPFAALAALSLSLALAGSSASAQSPFNPHKKVLGYQDESGNFHPLARVVPDASGATTYTGTIDVTFDITIKSSFPSGTKIYCSVDLTVESAGSTTFADDTAYEESGLGVASGTSGTSTCTVKIPYSWVLATPSKTVVDAFSASYSVVAISSSSPTVLTETVGERTVSGTIVGEAKVPAPGALTKYTVAATL